MLDKHARESMSFVTCWRPILLSVAAICLFLRSLLCCDWLIVPVGPDSYGAVSGGGRVCFFEAPARTL